MRKLLLWLPLLLWSPAFASEDDSRILEREFDLAPLFTALPGARIAPGERYERAEAVFRHFGAPVETPVRDGLGAFARRQNQAGLLRILPTLDPKKQFQRFFALTGQAWDGFLDRDQLRVVDYRVPLAGPGEPLRSSGLHERFRRAARSNPASRPLQGLRIALDPGHMGGDLWDERTGKQVKGKNGAKLSEGILNLQTALLLQREFTRMGAEVALTHDTIGPVSAVPFERLPIPVFAREELRNEGLSTWFENLLATGPAGPALFKAFEQSSQVKALFAESSRWKYYVLREDLAARWKVMEAFDPDISLIIHYDASGGSVSPVRKTGTKVYVVGSFDPNEFATQKSRARFSRQLLDPEAWESSLLLGRNVVGRLKNDLGLTFDKGGGGSSFQVEPGVFARNLAVSAALSGHAVSFLEVFHYDDPREFQLLRDYKYSLSIGGVETRYSERMVQVVNAIQRGVVEFVRSYASR